MVLENNSLSVVGKQLEKKATLRKVRLKWLTNEFLFVLPQHHFLYKLYLRACYKDDIILVTSITTYIGVA